MQRMSEKGVFVWIAVGLAIVVALVLIIVGGDEQITEEEAPAESSPASQETPVKSEPAETEDQNEDQREETSQPGEVTVINPPAEGLPANWHQLTDREKTALNPFDCPADENGVIHLSSETGECLQAKSDEEPPEEETSEPAMEDKPSFNFGETFLYDENSEIRVNGLSCQSLDSIKLHAGQANLTLDQFLEKHGEKYEEYKLSPSALYFDRGDIPIWHFTYFEYLHNLEKYLWSEGALQGGDFRAQLANYSDCKLEMTLKNVGPDSYFPDGCRDWSSGKSFSLVGEQQTYGRKSRDRLRPGYACTMAIVPFPNGAKEVNVVSFVVNADDEIVEIRVQSPKETFRIRRD